MPIYEFKNSKTGEEFETLMSISEREAYLVDHPHIRQLPPSKMNIVGSVGGIKNDDGWKENLDRISAAHPTSELAASRGSRFTSKEVKTRKAVEKWRSARAKQNP
jgi:hypothetical protein